MSIYPKNNSITLKYALITAVAVLITWEIHEFAHWLTGEMLGYNMTMTLNTANYINPAKASHEQIISAAGPIITIIEAIIVFVLMRSKYRKHLYPFLCTCFYSRVLAALMGFINLNDEARISKYLGIGTPTLPIIVSVILFAMVYSTSRRYGFSAKFNAATFGLIMLFSSILILADQFFNVRLI